MHRTRKTIIQRLKSIIRSIPTRCQALCAAEVYLPGHLWDALNPTERFASVADLCAHVGDQLPIQLVKLIARDILRELGNLHNSRGAAHGNINPNSILLSPTDFRALISQLRAETQSSLRPSELSIGVTSFSHEEFRSPETIAVFTLSNPESGDGHQRLEYSDCQALQPPETLIGAPCGTSTDMWALGCVLFELLTGEALFDPEFQTLELNISRKESHLIQMIELFGEMPAELVKPGKLSGQWFTEDGALRIDTTYYPITLGSVLERHLEKGDVLGTTAFLEMLLRIRPEDRAMPEDIIDDQWFSD
ncbi:kinase-like domain-containing protein [Flammula alnicola]|nr:kinase-like domain-containing protein [Flammula alnicola]